MATNSAEQSSQYVNTMVFCIIAGIISMMLLLLIMSASERIKKLSTFIITVEVGLLVIIVLAIWRLIYYEHKALKQAQTATGNKLSVNSCPDYWTRYSDTCVNGFSTSANPNVTYRVAGTATPADLAAQTSTISLTDYNNLSISDACMKVQAQVQAPWTDVRAVCDSFKIGGA